MRALLPLAVLAILSAPGVAQAADVATLADLNRTINHTRPLANHVLAWEQEGRPGYDCKGFVALKIEALRKVGVPDTDMAVLIVSNGTKTTDHAVLLLKAEGVVMDNMTPWLTKPADYRVLRQELPAVYTAVFDQFGR